jgi:hypothetical protein
MIFGEACNRVAFVGETDGWIETTLSTIDTCVPISTYRSPETVLGEDIALTVPFLG